jgi:hypothetical protein
MGGRSAGTDELRRRVTVHLTDIETVTGTLPGAVHAHPGARGTSMLFENKNAVIDGANGRIGGSVAKASARNGARVDALDEQAVDAHARAAQAGSICVSLQPHLG